MSLLNILDDAPFSVIVETDTVRIYDAEHWSSREYDYKSLGALIEALKEVRRKIHPIAAHPEAGGEGPDYPY